MKSPNLRHCKAHSQNKGLSTYQRRANRLWTGPFPARDKQAGGGGAARARKGAITVLERHPLPNCKEVSLLTKSS